MVYDDNLQFTEKYLWIYLLNSDGSNIRIQGGGASVCCQALALFLLADFTHEFSSESTLPCAFMDLDQTDCILGRHPCLFFLLVKKIGKLEFIFRGHILIKSD